MGVKRTIYVKMRQRLQVPPDYKLRLGDVAQMTGPQEVVAVLQRLPVYQITEKDKTHVVLDAMKVIEAIRRHDNNLEVNLFGSAATIVEIIYEKRKVNVFFFAVIWLLLFIGSGLAIIYFHEDVSMQQVHQRLYYMITGEINRKPLLFQIPYSLGLGLGMVLFFNHVFQKRINEEPSPLEVEVFQYQQSLDQYVLVNENKESTKQLEDD
ncbi:stage V sporulation protein AA [Ectobacillus sp. SYSU M60031]|uniref:Stage V sporulation protein AA n=1 Tax=Ectobacillus ponti TaxID=2961894 RepID=A0AA42BMZ5_9BACI|nr:stage V sporulation protein AA [Ectobacillus ponti]MCP8966941.1 stage V sporulation protein AA [Ectobacillus ponti]